MPVLNTPPTKSNQLAIQQDLETALDGYNLLDQKREILVMELVRAMDACREVQKDVKSRQARAYSTLRKAIVVNGPFALQSAAATTRVSHAVEMKSRQVVGIRLPLLELRTDAPPAEHIRVVSSNALIDQAEQEFLALLQAIGKLAELEASIWLLARELHKTQRHVNALDHLFIPDYKDTLHYIDQTLESRELDSFFTMKMIKKRLRNRPSS